MHRPPIRALVAVAALVALTLTGCSAPAPQPTDAAVGDSAAASFPVTIENAFGSTVIPKQPTRVVTWGWGSADDAIALGVIPVAMPFQAYAGDAQGVLPWISEALATSGTPTPTVLPDSTEPPYEDIAKAAPDVILAAYSGITAEQYALLSKIAPVVGYPDQPWATNWRDLITITGTALGKSAEATTLLAGIDAKIAAAAAAHPEFAGKSIALTSDSGGTFYVYKKEDPRVAFTLDLGFVNAPAVDALATDEASFYYTLSHEQLDKLTSDVLVNFGTTQEESDAFLSAGYAQAMPQVQRGSVASPVGAAFISSVSPPTGLSLTWGLDDYVTMLSTAAKAAE
ncbi:MULTISPECIES: ABC transporter substrate-binding protein [unclassified Cryobacterium]|uniref:ABC transporter substrate-binding protein n=1 Tax=unclassified Cryobacterium TaxID=2649013 RepID=UPI002AB36BE0|nr:MULTISPECIES: ABC transporter substrate-binding protein [unclassified Cryobacterium]MDY7528762.1 ABC transporter substrate-binding protein [Cryobacterium sp. 10C2]MDY7555494.1 ABC transporter substrate-binding protein [Cryobacterium sp. 10C3]MEB0201745.1 ABC transporter substrate-binding protein [Cryobacterium sp. 5I3]MEB0285267.1 ABC transporter substrate-binding protein [Cryobacterium sp. 10S3]MEB0289792.1 ABC transporter substrate-binding protein [Cryobacterium sp. 10C2]